MASFDLSGFGSAAADAVPDFSNFVEDPAMGAYAGGGEFLAPVMDTASNFIPSAGDAASAASSFWNPSMSTALLAGGALSAGSGLAKSLIGSDAAKSAAQTQANAAGSAAQVQWNQFLATQKNLQPYMNLGLDALPKFSGALGELTSPIDLSNLENLPGYKFVRDQGLQATQNGFAAKGLGTSGAAIKGAGVYAENLANTYWQDYVNSQLAQRSQRYNMLAGPVNTGLGAATGVGNLGKTTADSATAITTGGAAANAAGQVGSANAIGSGLNNLAGSGSSTAMLLALNNAGLFGPTN